MENLIVGAGALLVVAGLVGLVFCIVSLRRSMASSNDEEQLRDRIQWLLPVKMASFGIAILGLTTILLGVLL
ncbi:MAG: hypothetical protein OXB95_06595 [Rhodobacteraceae bacterium]|nr:hypothetical protein [Paracoccaceae bacterium]